MGGHRHAAHIPYLSRAFLQRKVRGADQQRVFRVDHLVVFVHDQLLAEKGRLIFFLRQMFFQHRAKCYGGGHIREISQHMHFLPGGDFNGGHQKQAVGVGDGLGRGQVPGGVVIGDRQGVQPLHRSHAQDVCRRHIIVAAGRKAGMDMQISEQVHVYSALSGTPFSAMRPQMA